MTLTPLDVLLLPLLVIVTAALVLEAYRSRQLVQQLTAEHQLTTRLRGLLLRIGVETVVEAGEDGQQVLQVKAGRYVAPNLSVVVRDFDVDWRNPGHA